MKKTLSIIMAICMLLGLTATMAYAGNGPSEGQSSPGLYDAYIGFFRVDEYGEVVRDESYKPESYYSFADNTAMGEMSGAVYDRPSNTLTITNFNKPDFLLEVNCMGDDFKLKVVGDCSLARIAVWGWDWGGSITITGDGKLVVNQNSTTYPAIVLYPEYSEGERLEIGPDVTVELYSSQGVIADNYSSAESAPFFFANSPEESLTISQYSEGGFIPTHISVYSGGLTNHGYQRTTLASDPDGVYGSQPTTWWADFSAGIVDHEGYTVYRFIYVESLDAYIYDPTFGDEFTSSTPAEVELSTEEFGEAGFEIVTNDSGEPIWDTYTIAGDYMSSTLYTDGTNYYYSYYSWDEDAQEVTEQFFHITPIEGFENVYLAGELAEGITRDDLTMVGVSSPGGASNFRVTNTELHVGPNSGGEQKLPFTDVKDGKWYTDAVKYVYFNGLMNGMTETTFEPNSDMSRAMLVTVLWRAEGSPAPKKTTPFTDLKSNWYKNAVAWAYENSIVKGMSETTFAPNASITREQIAAIFYRYAEFKGRDTSGSADITKFPDGAKVSKYAKVAMSWAVAEGLISGTKVGDKVLLDPKGNATRAQVATILMRYLESNPGPMDIMFDVIERLDDYLEPDDAGRLNITFNTSSTVTVDNLLAKLLAATGLDPDTYEFLIEDPDEVDTMRETYGGLGHGQLMGTDLIPVDLRFAIRNKVTDEQTDFVKYNLRVTKDVSEWIGQQLAEEKNYNYYVDDFGPIASESDFEAWLDGVIKSDQTLPQPDNWTLDVTNFDEIKAAYDAMADGSVDVNVTFSAEYEIPFNHAGLDTPVYERTYTVTIIAPAPV